MDKQTEEKLNRLKKEAGLPRHIAIIMDGNGRWARERKMPRIAGHKVGVESVRSVVRACAMLEIPVLSLFTFSVENWNRPDYEINALMNYLKVALEREFLELKNNNIRLNAMGRTEMLPRVTQKALNQTIEKLKGNTGTILNLCLSYGGRTEITDAARRIAEDSRTGSIDPEDIDEKLFSTYLYQPELGDPDLLIRTSGEFRVSNFMLWQLAYTEIVISDLYWPDFREDHLMEAIYSYLGRERRFGRVESN
ncbi:MAG: isoprenyl transferase [Candidatus Latescibacteria bacterium]|nr:isoprenyl transferase [bacterium]MBD3423030.1 isoprenyl transferase [Candidatus Latescibacterota bacterium]